jgi:hypothetical protein
MQSTVCAWNFPPALVYIWNLPPPSAYGLSNYFVIEEFCYVLALFA